MMFQESAFIKLLSAALMFFVQDLSNGGGAQAWTYNYSVSPSRRWIEARQWCQLHFTDMVVIQNQKETDFLNSFLPKNPRYYWIGIHKVEGRWIWVDTNEKVPVEAQNWASDEPDNIAGQDCVEMYIKRDKDTAKWNNEKCRNKKGTVCYSASCSQGSCGIHADCVETIGNYTCECHPGFVGPNCEEAISCKPLLDPENGFHHCFHPYGSNRFNTSCYFQCEHGFNLVGTSELECQANGKWNYPVPFCLITQCPILNHNISGGFMNCVHPIAPYSYNSTCDFGCDEGYEINGQDQIQCTATGLWTARISTCSVKKCSQIFFRGPGNVTCVDALEPFSYGSWCKFTCQEGFYLTGDNNIACLASGQWSKPTPTCTVVSCNRLNFLPHASMQCTDPLGVYSYSSVCTFKCDEGFDLIGSNMTKCLAQGNWSSQPVCQVKKCHPIDSPVHGSLNCSDPNGSMSFGSKCVFECNEGFFLNGTAETQCTSQGIWSTVIPFCQAKRCPTLIPPTHGTIVCSDPHRAFSFGSRCTSICDKGFFLNHTADVECTSLGMWSVDIPLCLAVSCPTLNSPLHGSLDCSDPNGVYKFGSQCVTVCEEGFVLNGTAETNCTSLGIWSAEKSSCFARSCPLPVEVLKHGRMNCRHQYSPFSFGSSCNFECDEGFWLSGPPTITCDTSGHWNQDQPTCKPRPCPPLIEAQQDGSMNCNHPNSNFSYGSHCDFECNEGFLMRGMPNMTCDTSGLWSQDLPTCHLVQCEAIHALSWPLSMNCSHPLGNFSFRSQCNFTCEEGFLLNGTDVLFCSTAGFWSDRVPTCTDKMLEVAAVVLYSSVGLSFSVVVVVLVLLTLLIVKQFEKKDDTIALNASSWGETEN